MKPSPIVYLEIPAPDIEKAGTFYSSVFGWSINRSSLSDTHEYWMFNSGEDSLSGGFDTNKKPQDGGVIIYLKVDDIPTALDSIKKAGGIVTREKFDIGDEYGFSATFKDPNGNHLGLWAQD